MFDLKDMEFMERHDAPAVEMIKRLRQHALPVARLYKVMKSLNLLTPCEILARESILFYFKIKTNFQLLYQFKFNLKN